MVNDVVKKKIILPPTEIKRRFYKTKGCFVSKVLYHPEYSELHLTVSENTLGISPVSIMPIEKEVIDFDIEKYNYSPYIKKKKERLSGGCGFVYALINSFSKIPFYIGCTKNDINLRLKQHKKRNTEIALLCICPVEFLYDEERRWILGAIQTHSLTNANKKHPTV